ncbi:MAG: DUF6785 family protein [Phycisphaeraceae bacterium]
MPTQSEQPYERVNVSQLSGHGGDDASSPADVTSPGAAPRAYTDVRWWIIPLSVLLCVAQAIGTVLAANLSNALLTPTLISVLAFGLLFLTVLVINPLLRAVFRERILRPLNRAELMSVFTAMLVTSGISTFGLTSQIVPMIATPWNPEWNTAQRGWREDILPELNPALFLSTPVEPGQTQRNAALTVAQLIEAHASDAADAEAAVTVRRLFEQTGLLEEPAAARSVVDRLDATAVPILAAGLNAARSALPEGEAPADAQVQAARERARELIGSLSRVREVRVDQPGPDASNAVLRARLAALSEQAERIWSGTRMGVMRQITFRATPPEEVERVLGHILDFRRGLQPTDASGQALTQPAEDAPLLGEDGKLRYWRAVFMEIPWGAWMKPLSAWLIFIAASYGMFYSLTYVVLGYWVKREKLIFPLAQLPEQLLPEEGSRRWLPYTLRTAGFWFAFALVFLIWTWNGSIAAEWIPGMGKIPLGMSRWRVTSIVEGGIFEGVTGGQFPLMFLIIFTAVGVAFLLPTEVSFSMWFYFLVGKAIILALVWFGYGQTGDDFPSGFFGEANTVTAQGGGGLLMFAAISLGRALWDFVHLGRGKSAAQKLRLSMPVIALAVSLAVFYGWLVWCDLGWVWAAIVTAVLTLITMGLMRIVAEGGVYWIQAHISPLHIYKTLGLGALGGGWLKMAAVPFIPIHSILYFDVKAFLAPNLANAAKLREDTGASRAKFHLNIILCITVSVIVAIGCSLFLAHLIGAQQMGRWFYTAGPQYILSPAQTLANAEPEFDLANTFSYTLGGAWVAFSLLLRRTLFWFPHPIGYVMLVNPLMAQLWFSFFLGWIAKKGVVKYGGKQTYDRTRPIFIGLILGEIIAILVWAILGITLGFSSGVSMNRYGP